MALFRQMLDEGYISARQHPTDNLTIYNYTPKAQYANEWNPVTMQCRGLIADGMDRVVGRPWAKFFNYGQPLAPEIPLHATVTAMDKADGSLGIIYRASDGLAVATRGSFTSEQAQHGTEILRAKYRQDFPNLEAIMDRFTILVEVVYPANRIVLDYGDQDDLVLLGAVSTTSGVYLDSVEAQTITKWTGPVAEIIAKDSFSNVLSLKPRPNAEGLVVRYANSLVKIKQEDYLELHRARFNLTPRRVWEQLAEGKSIKEVIEILPDEFQDEAREMAEQIIRNLLKRKNEISQAWYEMVRHFGGPYRIDLVERRALAEYLKGNPFRAELFLLFDRKYDALSERNWKAIRP